MTKIISIKNKMLTVPAIAPAYMAKFQCIGPECQDHCCRKWHVNIDKQHYQYLRNQAPEGLRVLASESIKQNPASKNDASFAVLGFKGDDGTCAMLDERKLCKIHADVGADALPDVCYIYPRSQWRHQGVWRQSGMLSCPEVARLCLTDPQAMVLTESAFTSRATVMNDKTSSRPGTTDADINAFLINLFQVRDYPFWQRMALMVMCCAEADRLLAEGRAGEITDLLDTFSAAILSGECRQWLDPVKPDFAEKVMVAIPLFQKGIGREVGLQFDTVIKLFALGYGIAEPLDQKKIELSYQAIWHLKLQPFLDEHPYFLENWFLNHFFHTGFPLNYSGALLQGCAPIVVKYTMVMFLLGGMAVAQGEEFDLQQAVWAVQVIEKTFEHNVSFRNHLTLDVAATAQLLNLLAEPADQLPVP